jgi:hypothetical protein
VQQLGRLTHLDFKRCHHVGQVLLGKLAGSCPSLVSLRPSRWTDSAALAQLARFSRLQVGRRAGQGGGDVPHVRSQPPNSAACHHCYIY